MAIKVRLKTLKNGNEEIIHPETDWSIVVNRPSITVGSDGEKWGKSGSSSIRLDGNRIYVKDYLRDEVLLENYPIRWSAVSYKPTITVDNNGETWGTSNASIRLYGDRIYVKDYLRDEVLLEDYPINWSAISGKPDYIPLDKRVMVFGRYSDVERVGDHEERGNVYPAIRYYKYYSGPAGESYEYHSRYWSGSSWLEVPKEADFIPGL